MASVFFETSELEVALEPPKNFDVSLTLVVLLALEDSEATGNLVFLKR